MSSGSQTNRTMLTNTMPTKWVLTLWYALIMLLIALGAGFSSYHLFEEELVERDAHTLSVLSNNMDRLYKAMGPEKVLSVLERDRYFLRLSGYSASLWDSDGDLLFKEGADLPVSAISQLDDGSLVAQKQFGSWLLIMSLSSDLRMEDLASFRNVMLQTLLILWITSIALVAYLNGQMLNPIRQLVNHVKHLQRKGLQDQLPLSASEHSELGQLTLLFNQQMSRIDQLICSLEDTLNSAAHDLRTPLTRMRLSAERALTKDDTESIRESLLDCLEESERMLAMVNSLLDVAAVEQQLDARDRKSTNLHQLIREAAEVYEYLAEEKELSLHFDLPESMDVSANPDRLRQVFANLLDNAVKFTPAQGHIHVTAEANNQHWLIKVQDTGRGIPEKDVSHIFSRLYRGDASRSTPGFGLGLSLVKAIIESHGGSISVTSEPDIGTVFLCSLPMENSVSISS